MVAFRLLCEPKRLWKRYLVDDVVFFLLLLKQKFNFVLKKDRKDDNRIWEIADRF